MKDWLERLTDVSAIGNCEFRLESALENLAENLGFDGYAFLHIEPFQSFAVSNYAAGWQSLYFDRNYHAVDPVVLRGKSLNGPFVWSSEEGRSHLEKEQRGFFQHASDFGIRSGVTIPVRTPNGFMSMFTLASGKSRLSLDRDIDAVAAASAVGQLHARIAFLRLEPTTEETIVLDPKAAAYLRWAAVGKSMGETACIEGVKYNSVKVKLENTKKSFDVRTTAHLVALAIRRGLI